MPTYILDRDTMQFMEKSAYYAKKYGGRSKRGDMPTPRVIGDTVEIVSMADGKTYTSKADYRRSLKAQGMIEVGNDAPRSAPQWDAPKANTTAEIEQSLGKAWKQLGGD